MAKITWTDKTTLNPQPSIARENKVIDDDMNEIKQVVNTNDDNVGDLADLNTTDKTSVVNAVNELATGWTLLGTQTGTTPIALPNNFKELIVELDTISAGNYQYYFIKSMLSSTAKSFRNGGFITASNNCSQVQIDISTSSVSIGYVYQNGENDATSTSTLKVWYR
jgi:hypothetical protein